MNAAKPPREDAILRRLIDEGGRVRPLSDGERRVLFGELAQRLEGGPRAVRMGLLLSLLAASSLLVGGLFHALRAGEHVNRVAAPVHIDQALRERPAAPPAFVAGAAAAQHVSLGGRGEIVLDPAALARLPANVGMGLTGPLRFELERGQLTADVATRADDEPLSIVTPHVVVHVVGTRFSVVVGAAVTSVSVEHGRVRVERGGRSLFVAGGEALRSDDARFTQTPSASPKRNPAHGEQNGLELTCDRVEQRLRRAARGSGLRAENALLSLALHARERGLTQAALAHLREYERRFPGGMLTREAALATARTLMQTGQHEQACAYAEQYAARSPDDASTVALLRADCSDPKLRVGAEQR